jgi:tryptophan 2,3-dioxygenase
MEPKALTYSRYLCLDELLALQRPLSEGPEHDETLFIVVHQVYELWFKQILHELHQLLRSLATDDHPGILHTLRRILTILKTLVAQVDVIETMTPVSFASFRKRLESASGFQSLQFRLLELTLGRKDEGILSSQPEGSPSRRRLEEALAQVDVYRGFLGFVGRRGYPIPKAAIERDPRLPSAEDPAVQDVLVDVYRRDPAVTQVCERLVDLDEGLQEWRYRHAKMVERTIGSKPGTGGSSGTAYLRGTLFQPLFPDLWAIRRRL